MKLKRTPLILLAIATLFGLGVYFHEGQKAPQQQESQNQGQPLFAFKEEEVQSFTVKTPQQTLAFTKMAASPAPQKPGPGATSSPSPTAEASVWRMTSPKATVASNASVAYLLNLLAIAKQEKTLTVPAAKQAEFGFDTPLAIVDVTLKDQKTHRLVLGKPDFNRSYLYAQVDPPPKPQPELAVSLVPMDFENAVKRPLTEWEGQPAQPSPTSTRPKP